MLQSFSPNLPIKFSHAVFCHGSYGDECQIIMFILFSVPVLSPLMSCHWFVYSLCSPILC